VGREEALGRGGDEVLVVVRDVGGDLVLGCSHWCEGCSWGEARTVMRLRRRTAVGERVQGEGYVERGCARAAARRCAAVLCLGAAAAELVVERGSEQLTPGG